MPNSARVIKGQPDNTFMVVRNQSAAALVNGECVMWIVTGDTTLTAGVRYINGYVWIPGVDVKSTSVAGTGLAVGPMRIPANLTLGLAQGDYGVVQVGGYHPQAKTNAAALATGVVVQADATGGLIVADVAAAADIGKRRLGVCINTGANNKAGVIIRSQ